MQNKKVYRDKFGNEQKLVALKPNKNGYPVGYLEVGGKLFKMEYSPASSDNRAGAIGWVRVTALKKQTQTNRGSF